MQDDVYGLDQFNSLRMRVEQFLNSNLSVIKKMPPRTVRNLVEDLQIYRMELERQNKELRRIQHKLKVAHDKYFGLYDFAPVGYFSVNDKGLILEANSTGASMLGMEKMSLAGNFFTHFIREEDCEAFNSHCKILLESKASKGYELKLLRTDGSEFHAQLEFKTVYDAVVRFKRLLIAVSDINARKQAEEVHKENETKLRQAHKMEALGTLAGGIAHEFNNILGIIVGNAELAMDGVFERKTVYCNLEKILAACLRARDVVKEFLAFSRQTKTELKPVSLSRVIKDSLKSLRFSIPATIKIHKDILSRNDTVRADSTQINQVLLNLYTNAVHAMKNDGGILNVGLENVDLDMDGVTPYHELNPGEYMKVTVSDSGCGIKSEILGRIFDPYFTTRAVGEGTGMGLAMVHSTVKNHGGDITVHSELDKGTTFYVLLPVIENEIKPEIDYRAPIPKGNERILFVDDEESLVYTAERSLGKLGYEVVAERNPIRALKIFKEHAAKFDLVITDMTMPDMTGDRFAEKVMNIRPGIPVILCTGHSERISRETAKEMGIRAFVLKPVLAREMANTVRKVLDEMKL